VHIEFVIADGAENFSRIRELFLEYQQSLGMDLCFQNFSRELAELPGDYGEPEGRLYLIRCDDKLAGCIALRKMENGVCEMKRLYIRKEFRGWGVGRKAAELIIEQAGMMGYKTMRLDTLPSMTEAIALYKSLDFREIEPYRFNPVEGTVYMEKSLKVESREQQQVTSNK